MEQKPLEVAVFKYTERYGEKLVGANMDVTLLTLVDRTNGKEKKYTFFKTKKDGGLTKAFQDVQNLNLGDLIEVHYETGEYKYVRDGEEKTGTRRTVRFVNVLPSNTVVANSQSDEVIQIDDSNVPF